MPTTRREALLSGLAVAGAAVAPLGGRSEPPSRQASQAVAAAPVAVSLADFESLARKKMAHAVHEFVAGAAGDEITLAENHGAYDRIKLHPRMLRDVSHLDTRVTLFGDQHAAPLMLAPAAYHKVIHPEGEIATVRGASAANVGFVVSSFSTVAIEEIARVATTPLWFQLYVQADRGFTRSLVERAERAGCRALCVTIDTPVSGPRNRESRANFQLPPGLDRPHLRDLAATQGASHRAAASNIYSPILDPTLTWKDIEWLASFATVPLLVKGVMSPDDAELAVRSGVKGVFVSNHGGRNLDTLPATIDVLPRVVERVAGRVPVLVDGGIRRGTDILKALAYGAAATLIGRPYLYGLAVAGADGVAQVVRILRTELEMAMALTGRTTLADIDRSVIWSAEC